MDNYNDPKTWTLIQEGRTKGCFQIESALCKAWCKKILPSSIDELSAVISLVRPGALEAEFDGANFPTHYARRKNGLEPIEYKYECLRPALEKTYGILTYQEEVLSILKDIAGFTLQEADLARKCIAKGSYVLTNNGPRRIEKILPSNQILSVDHNGRLVYKKIKRIWSNGVKPVYKIRTENGFNIRLTENHQVFTQRGWIKTEDLLTEDFVVIPNKYTYKGYNKTNVNKTILTAYILSEGYHCKKSTTITNKDPYVLDLIQKIISTEFGNNQFSVHINTQTDCSCIRLKGISKKWANNYIKFGKSRSKTIPSSILHNMRGITKAFLGAYFSAEGSVNRLSLEISSTSKAIVRQLQLLLLRDGIHGSLQRKCGTYKDNKYISYRIYIGCRDDIVRFMNSYKEYICPAKLLKLEELINKPFKKSNSKFLVPSIFIQSATKSCNVNSLFGKPNINSGSIYQENLTYDKAILLNKYINSELLTDITTAEYKFVKIKQIAKMKKEVEVFDYEVDDDTIHYGFIDGFLVHNSIGKKLPEEMTKVKKMFLDGCKQLKIVTEEQAQEIFEWIEKSQRYLFVRAHGIAYAILGYDTAYLKAHHPLQFYVGWLRHAHEKIDPLQEKAELISDAKMAGIEVRVPKLTDLKETFYIKNDTIYFGLGNVKSVGAAQVKKITKCLSDIDLTKITWFEFLKEYSDKINKTALVNLISVGALDEFGHARNKMIYEYDLWNKLTDKEKEFIRGGKTDNLKDALIYVAKPKSEGGGCSNKNRVAEVQDLVKVLDNPPYSLDDTPGWIAQKEKELLGISITFHSVDDCDTETANCTCKDFLNGYNNKNINIAVSLDRVSEYTITKGKNEGQVMAFITGSDSTAQLDNITCFGAEYATFKDILIEGNTVIISGTRSKQNSLIVKVVTQI